MFILFSYLYVVVYWITLGCVFGQTQVVRSQQKQMSSVFGQPLAQLQPQRCVYPAFTWCTASINPDGEKDVLHGKDTLGPKARFGLPPPTTRVKFLLPGQLPSALLIRLLLSCAGDVESNPGPRCKACFAKSLRTSQAHLTCSGCGDSSHKQERCSGLSRTAQGRVVWTCSECDQSRPSSSRNDAIVLVGQIVGTGR